MKLVIEIVTYKENGTIRNYSYAAKLKSFMGNDEITFNMKMLEKAFHGFSEIENSVKGTIERLNEDLKADAQSH